MDGVSAQRSAVNRWRQRVPLLALILGAILIGLVPIGVRYAKAWGEIGPLSIAFWRFALAAALLVPWVLATPAARGGEPWRLPILAGAGLAFAADIGCFFVAIALTSVANATLLSNLAPVVVVAITAFVLRRRVAGSGWIGAGIAVAGVALLARGVHGGAGTWEGDTFGIVSALFYGLYQLAISAARRDQHALRVMLSVAVVGAVALLPFALFFESGALLPRDSRGWLALLVLAWVTQIGGQGLITWSLRHLPSSFASVTLLVQPLVAAVLGWICFAEVLGAAQAAGGVLILVGIIVARRALTQRAP